MIVPTVASVGDEGLIELLYSLRPNYGDVGTRDVDVVAARTKIEAAIDLLAARAAPGVPTLTDEEKLQRTAMMGMADCMAMVRDDLIEMGIIDKTVAPMFIPEAVAKYVRGISGAPVSTLTDEQIAGIMGWRGPGAYTAATLRKIREVLAASPKVAVVEPLPFCLACEGSGESAQMSDSGPDAYEQLVPCQSCNGDGGLAAAYQVALAQLDAERKANMELSAKLFFAPTKVEQVSDDKRDAERYRWLKMFASPGAQTNLMSTPWMQWDAVIDASSPPQPINHTGEVK